MGLSYPRKKGWSAREERRPGRKKAEKKDATRSKKTTGSAIKKEGKSDYL